MSKTRSRYSEEFKREAVQLMETSGKPIVQLALGISDNNLYRWRGLDGNNAPTSSNGTPATKSGLEAELKRLRRENAVLRQERDVLKKAMRIVSRSQP